MQQNCSFIFSSFVRSFVYLSASFFVYLIICFFVHLFMPIYCVLINFFYSLSHLMNYSFTCFFIYWLTVFVHLSVCLFIYLRVRSINSLGFTAGVQINKRVGPACSTSDWKINRPASMQADPFGFFPSANTPRNKPGGLGVNKRNRGYPADCEFIERTLNKSIITPRKDRMIELQSQLDSKSFHRNEMWCDVMWCDEMWCDVI